MIKSKGGMRFLETDEEKKQFHDNFWEEQRGETNTKERTVIPISAIDIIKNGLRTYDPRIKKTKVTYNLVLILVELAGRVIDWDFKDPLVADNYLWKEIFGLANFYDEFNEMYGTGKYDNPPLKVGDIVTRDGSDRHEVIIGQDDFDTIRVKCIKAPDMPWAKVGNEEDNLARRYSLVEGRRQHVSR